MLASLTNAAAFNYYCNDDAYISFTYANNLLNGKGLVFNPGERVEGYTNFLWLIFLTPWMKFLPATDVSIIAITWGAVFSIGVLIITYYLAYLVNGEHSWRNLIAPALLSFDNTFHYWSVSGLENGMQAVLVLSAYLFVLRQEGQRNLLYAGILFALATMARPDSGLFWAVSLAAVTLQAAKSRSSFRGPFQLALGFLLIAVPYAAWKWIYYGNVLPNTFYLHTGDRMLRIARGESYFWRFLQNRFYIPLLCIIVAFSGYKFRAALFLVSIFSYAFYVIWMGGDFFPGSRFFYILLPLIYLLIQDAVIVIARSIRNFTIANTAATIVTLLLCAGIFYGSYGALGEYRNFVLVWAEDDAQRIQLARDLARVRKEGDSILAGPIGQIGYYSGMQVLDYWGVIDPHIARMKVQNADSGTAAHEKTDIEYLLNRKPTYILFGVDPQNPPSGYAIETLTVENRRWKVLKRTAQN